MGTNVDPSALTTSRTFFGACFQRRFAQTAVHSPKNPWMSLRSQPAKSLNMPRIRSCDSCGKHLIQDAQTAKRIPPGPWTVGLALAIQRSRSLQEKGGGGRTRRHRTAQSRKRLTHPGCGDPLARIPREDLKAGGRRRLFASWHCATLAGLPTTERPANLKSRRTPHGSPRLAPANFCRAAAYAVMRACGAARAAAARARGSSSRKAPACADLIGLLSLTKPAPSSRCALAAPSSTPSGLCTSARRAVAKIAFSSRHLTSAKP
mmetsp:Transcript_26180/g.65954  ORF Transcript_26180/g.65954 Transcript_26180/m.65954 type:complete len:263 (-) Transcript_26180:2521-3309(-)